MALSVLAATLGQALLPGLVKRMTGGRGKGGKVLGEIAEIALEATGLTADSEPDEVMKALAADPTSLAQVQVAAAEKAVAEIEAQIRAQEIAAQDRADARSMNVKGEGRATGLLALGAVLMATATVASLIAMTVYGVEPTVLMAGLLGTVLGTIMSNFEKVMAFYFGSSAGSKKKTQLMEEL